MVLPFNSDCNSEACRAAHLLVYYILFCYLGQLVSSDQPPTIKVFPFLVLFSHFPLWLYTIQRLYGQELNMNCMFGVGLVGK
jgi:hypothetical protein